MQQPRIGSGNTWHKLSKNKMRWCAVAFNILMNYFRSKKDCQPLRRVGMQFCFLFTLFRYKSENNSSCNFFQRCFSKSGRVCQSEMSMYGWKNYACRKTNGTLLTSLFFLDSFNKLYFSSKFRLTAAIFVVVSAIFFPSIFF